jgi:hypothetical protein
MDATDTEQTGVATTRSLFMIQSLLYSSSLEEECVIPLPVCLLVCPNFPPWRRLLSASVLIPLPFGGIAYYFPAFDQSS